MPRGEKGKAEDFAAAALPHLNELYRTAVCLGADRARAEDLVQETYLQAWQSFHRFQMGTNCRAWLFKILIHKNSHHRRRWLRRIKESEDALSSLTYEPPVSEHLRDEEILSALEKIPEHYREVILLVDVEDFSYKEVAFVLKIPIGTVMSRLSRGRKLLRGELGAVAAAYGIVKDQTANGKSL